MRSRQAIGINASVDTVWDLVNDIPKWADIIGRGNLTQVQHWESGPPYAYRWTTKGGILTLSGESKFVKFEPPNGFLEETVTSAKVLSPSLR